MLIMIIMSDKLWPDLTKNFPYITKWKYNNDNKDYDNNTNFIL